MSLNITHSPLHIAGVGTDQGIYQYVGSTILDHGVPYKDAWDHKQPLTYMIHALGLLISNGSLWGIWFVELILLSIAGIFAFQLSNKFCNNAISLMIVLSSLLTIWCFSGYYNPEQLALPFYMVTLVLFISFMSTHQNSRKRLFYAVLIGMLVACSFFLKQSLISVGAAILLIYLLDIFVNKRWTEIKPLAFIALGFLVITGIFLTYLGLNRALDDYWQAAYQFNFLYTQTGLLEKVLSVVDDLESISTFPGLFVLLVSWICISVISLLLQTPRIKQVIGMRYFRQFCISIGAAIILIDCGKFILDGSNEFGLVKSFAMVIGLALLAAGLILSPNSKAAAWKGHFTNLSLIRNLQVLTREARILIYLTTLLFPITLLLNSLSGEHYDYYKISFFPSMVLTQVIMIFLLLSLIKEESGRNLLILAAIGFWVGSAISPFVSLIAQYRSKPDNSFLAGVDYIKETTNDSNTIYVWGTNTSIYVMAGRKSPTRYFYQLAAVNWSPYEKKFGVVDEILNTLTKNKPTLFIIPDFITLGNDKKECLDLADNLGSEAPIFEFLCQNYYYDKKFSDFQIYRLIADH